MGFTWVWLKSLKSQLSKTFFGLKIWWNIKEVISKNISDNIITAILLMSHVGDVGDVKYLNAM